MNIRHSLTYALTQYDLKQSRRKGHNPYALGIYLTRVDDVIADIDAGQSPRQAILAGFNDRLLDLCLKAIGEPISTADERSGSGILYTPKH